MELRQPAGLAKAAVAQVAVAALLGGWLFRHLGGFQWDNDEGSFAGVARAVADGQPLYTAVWYDHPPGLAWFLGALTLWQGSDVELLRAACLALAFVGVAAVAALAHRLGGAPAGLVAIPLLVFAPHFYWLSRSINPDLPAMGLALIGLALAWRAVDADRAVVWWFGAGVALGAGISIKLSPLVLVAPLGLLALRAGATERRRAVTAASALGLGGASVVATWLLAAPPAAVVRGVVGTFVAARAAFPDRSAEYAQRLVFENLLAENLGLTLLAALGLVVLWDRSRWDTVVAATWLASTFLALYGQRPLWAKHHWSLVLWPLATLAAVGLAGGVGLIISGKRSEPGASPESRARGGQPASAVARILAAGILGAFLLTLPATAARLRAGHMPEVFSAGNDGLNWLSAHTTPADVVVSDNGIIPFVTGRRVPVGLEVVSSKRIGAGELTADELIAATDASKAAAILSYDGLLERFPSYMDWVKINYRRAQRVGDDRAIWQRRGLAAMSVPEGSSFRGIGRLEGYDVSPVTVRPGRPLTLTFHWRSGGPTAAAKAVFVHLVDPAGTTVAQADGQPVDGTWPTTRWRPGQPVPDARQLIVPIDAQPGPYTLRIGWYDPSTGQRVEATREDGEGWNEDAVTLPTEVTVEPATSAILGRLLASRARP